MKRLCFGTLMSILYQARNQKVTNNLLCDAIFSSYAQSIELRDGSLPGHLKSGRDNVPSMNLLTKLGYENLGYIDSIESQAFGKWVKESTLTKETLQ